MLRACLSILALVPALTLVACAAEKPSDDPSLGATEETIPSGDYHLAGTYIRASQHPGDLVRLVLKTDGTYHAETLLSCSPMGCVPGSTDGKYGLFQREQVTYFELYSTHGDVFARYQYNLEGEDLSLRQLDTESTWFTIRRSPAAWCAVTQDCALQELIPGPCAGQYLCESQKSLCNYHCGSEPPTE